MSKIFKGFGKGLLYILGCPFLMAGLVIAAVLSLFIYFFEFAKLVILFFSGRTLFSPLKEDIEAKAILDNIAKKSLNNEDESKNISAPTTNTPIYDAVFNSSLEKEYEEAKKNENNANEINSDNGGGYEY